MEVFRNIFQVLGTLLLALNTHTITATRQTGDDTEVKVVHQKELVEIVREDSIKPIKGSGSSSSTGWWEYPSDIKECTRNGDDLLVLVNKEYRLPKSYAPKDLVSASLSGIRKGESYLLRSILIEDLKSLVSKAKSEGVDLSIRSGYRSYNTQISTYNHWLSVNGGNVAATDKISARAGHSQHQLGTAIDFSSSEIADGLGGTFSGTKASKWLAGNAWKYGFVISFPSGYESITGYSYESWHYRYIGKSNAQEMINSGMILEIYLRSKN